MPQLSHLALLLAALGALAGLGRAQLEDDVNACQLFGCDEYTCVLPNCSCPSVSPPNDLDIAHTPQFVLFTFNDVVKREFYAPFVNIFTKSRRNPSGLRISTTLFVSDKPTGRDRFSTDYCLVRRLYQAGHEVASHTYSHKTPADYWKSTASLKEWEDELIGQWQNLTEDAGVPGEAITGARAPFLHAGGDQQFRVLYTSEELSYDSSLLLQPPRPGIGYWPFTLDHLELQGKQIRCTTGRCPERCYKGLWEVPLQSVVGVNGQLCAFLDACLKSKNQDIIYDTLKKMYDERRESNKAPLVLNINMNFFEENAQAEPAIKKFLDYILEEDDTFVVSISQMLDWLRNPVPLDKLDAIKSLYKMEERETAACNTKRGVGGSLQFIEGTTLLIVEVLVLGVAMLVLIARDSA